MATKSHVRKPKRFLISGVQEAADLHTLKTQIKGLGGRLDDNGKNNFISLCTHVIVKDFNLTEKVLGGLASGKWLVQLKYIADSHREGRWLDERQYEINELARSCRLQHDAYCGGLYLGWKVYIKMENIGMTKSFRRIVAAGGAEVLSHKEVSHADFIITDKKLGACLRTSVGINIPIVFFTYIKETLVKRVDPTNLKPFLLDPNGNGYLARKMDLTTPTKRSISHQPKRPLSEVQIFENKKVCSKEKDGAKNLLSTTFQQSKMDQYIQIDSPGRASPIFASKRTPSSTVKRRYTFSQATPDRQPGISKYLLKKETTDESEADIQVLAETPAKKKGVNNESLSASDSDCLVTNVVKAESVKREKFCLEDLVDDKKKEEFLNQVRKRMAYTHIALGRSSGNSKHSSSEDIIDLTSCNNNNSAIASDSSVSERSPKKNVMKDLVGRECPMEVDLPGVSSDSGEERTVLSCTSQIDDWLGCSELRTDEFVTSSPQKGQAQRESQKESKSDQSIMVQTENGERSLAAGMFSSLLKKVTVNIGPRIDDLMSSKADSFMKVSKEEMKKSIGKFIRKSKALNGVYCGSVSVIDEGAAKAMNGIRIFNGSSEPCISPEVRELNIKEISYFESSMDQNIEGVESVENEEQSFLMSGLDSLYLNITPLTYLPSSVFGDILRRLILETKFKEIHSMALNLAQRILSFQPPINSHWRYYYYDTLVAAMQNQSVGDSQPWRFIRSVIEATQKEESDEEDFDSRENMPTAKMENAVNLLSYLILVLREDLRHLQKGENICNLLCWKIFMDQSRNPTIITHPIKQLIRLWVSMGSMRPVVRQHIASLLSIVFELLWKYERPVLLPVSPLPTSLTPLSTELLLQLKDLIPSQCLNLLYDFSSPWPKMVVSTFIFQEIVHIHNQKVILGDIIDYSQAVLFSQSISRRSPEVSPTKSPGSPMKKFRISQNVNKRNVKGETALMRACINNSIERVEALLEVPSIDINLPDHVGWTPLHEAALRGHNECIKLMLGFNYYDVFRKWNSTYLSAEREHFPSMLNLTARGGQTQETPLHDAISYNQIETVKLLLSHGGPDLLLEKNNEGNTPMDVAKTDEMKKLLDSYGPRSSAVLSSNKKQAYIKTTIMASGFSKPQGLLPCSDDRLTLALQFINSYLEASGTRAIRFIIQKEFRKGTADQGKHKSRHMENGEYSGTKEKNGGDQRREIDEEDAQKNGNGVTKVGGQEASSGLPSSQDSEGDLSEEERALAAQLYEAVRTDVKLYSRYKESRPRCGEEWRFLDDLVSLFV